MCKIVDFPDRPKQYAPTPGPTLRRWLDEWPSVPTMPDEVPA